MSIAKGETKRDAPAASTRHRRVPVREVRESDRGDRASVKAAAHRKLRTEKNAGAAPWNEAISAAPDNKALETAPENKTRRRKSR